MTRPLKVDQVAAGLRIAKKFFLRLVIVHGLVHDPGVMLGYRGGLVTLSRLNGKPLPTEKVDNFVGK